MKAAIDMICRPVPEGKDAIDVIVVVVVDAALDSIQMGTAPRFFLNRYDLILLTIKKMRRIDRHNFWKSIGSRLVNTEQIAEG